VTQAAAIHIRSPLPSHAKPKTNKKYNRKLTGVRDFILRWPIGSIKYD
jgi:hypothetical protein